MRKLLPGDALDAFLPLFAFFLFFSVTGIEASLLACTAVLLWRAKQAGALRALAASLPAHPLFFPWTVFLGACLLTALTAYDTGRALGQLNSDLLRYVCFATLMLAVSFRHLPRLSLAYAAGAAVSGFIGIGQVLKVFPINRPPLELRAGGFMNPVRYGEVMALASAFLAAKLLYPERNSRRENVFYAVAGVFAFAGLVLSQTRGAYLGFTVFLALAFLFARGRRLRALGLAAAMAVIAFGCTLINPKIAGRAAVVETRAGQGEVVEEAVGLRLQLWQVGWAMFRDHPVLGVGPDNIKPLFTKYKPDLIGNAKWGSMHNLYLQHAAERGLLGLGAVLALFLSFSVYAYRALRRVASPYALWAACALPGYFVMNLTENSFQHVHTSFAALLALALAAAASSGEEKAKL